jgi:hypothetical protein
MNNFGKRTKELDAMAIQEIENKIEGSRASAAQALYEMYSTLEYIKRHNRHQEHSRYKTVGFYTYLKDRFGIGKVLYQQNVAAFRRYPLEALELGVGMAVEIHEKCGVINAQKVYAEINKSNLSHVNPISRASIDAIIQKYMKAPVAKITKTHTDWEAMYQAEREEHEKTIKTLERALATVDMLSEQLSGIGINAASIVRMSGEANNVVNHINA